MLTLTGKEIRDLAEAVGLVITPNDYADELETEMTIIECPPSGVLDDDGQATYYKHVAYLSEYPEEGTYPLGDEVNPSAAYSAREETLTEVLARLRAVLNGLRSDDESRQSLRAIIADVEAARQTNDADSSAG